MIGDFKGLLRSLNAFKAFAAYNMVLLHAVAIMHPVLASFGYENHLVRGSMLRGLFSITLPAFAGFFLRHLLGPYLHEGKLRENLWPRMKDMILAVLVFEAVRMYTVAFHVGWSFAWQALHFIALSVLATYFCLRRGKNFLIAFVLIDVLLIQFVMPGPFHIPPSILVMGKYLQSLAMGLLFAWGIYRWKRNSVLAVVGLISGYILMFFTGFRDPITLVSFLQLPVGIFAYVPGSVNYLPFIPLYPLFMAGYFFRSFFFDVGNRKWFFPMTLLMMSFLTLGGYFAFSGVDAGVANVFSTEIYRRGIAGTAFFISLFYFDWMLFYYLLRGDRFPIVDHFIRWGGNVLSLYFIHWIMFILLKEYLIKNPELVRSLGGLPALYVLMHVVYGLCVFLSYNFVKFSNRFQRQISG